MNSRAENGQMTYNSRNEIIDEVNSWLSNGEIEEIYEMTDKYISYESNDGITAFERRIYFPDTDSLDRIKENMVYDEKVKGYVNPEKVAEFIYNCIDVNALASVKGIALLFDEPVLDENGEIEGYQETEGRRKLMELVTDGCDEYAYEVGQENLGIVWFEHSTVIINIGELVKTSEEIAKDLGISFDDKHWKDEFSSIFNEGLTQTICHEFRHAVYEFNEFTPTDDERYPQNGGLESNVEEYGNSEAWRLMRSEDTMKYIDEMCTPIVELEEELEV